MKLTGVCHVQSMGWRTKFIRDSEPDRLSRSERPIGLSGEKRESVQDRECTLSVRTTSSTCIRRRLAPSVVFLSFSLRCFFPFSFSLSLTLALPPTYTQIRGIYKANIYVRVCLVNWIFFEKKLALQDLICYKMLTTNCFQPVLREWLIQQTRPSSASTFYISYFFSFIPLIHEGSHREVYQEFQPSYLWRLPQMVPRVVQTTGSVHPQPTLRNC